MGRSLRLSEVGLKKAEEAFHLTGWTQDYLAGSIKSTRQTVSKFFARGHVEKRIFEAICSELNLTMGEIADFESEEGQLNTSVSVNGNREKNFATLTQKETKNDEERLAYSIIGTASKVDLPKLKAIVAHLQKLTGDTSIEIVDIEKGSVRLILEGSQESLEQIEILFKSGILTKVEGILVEDVQFVTTEIYEYDEDIKVIDKKRLAFTIAGSASSEEIQELKAVFTETSDNDEKIKTNDKSRLVQEIITKRAKERNLHGADLSGADLSGANLINVNLSSANLSSANLSSANLSSADLSSADLSGANLSSANLSSADLSSADLSSAYLSSADLSGADLSSADLSSADLSSADLSSADLSGANLRGARIDAQTKIDSKWRLVWEIANQGAREQDLIGIDLSGANLINVNLRGANLSSANLSSANLSSANLSSANLSSANLSAANLKYVNLICANLGDAELSGANLSNADLSGANLNSANLRNVNIKYVSLISSNLSGANLNGANLRNTDLSDANLSGAVVEEAQFGANLGLTEEVKLDLEKRGAIFEDSPGDRSGVLSRR